MSPERLNFFRNLIRTSNVDVMHDMDMVEYSIDMDDGSTFAFACVCTTDDQGRPGRYYNITLDTQILCEGICLDNKKPNEHTKHIMDLVMLCSNKILAQEMHARQNGILAQIDKNKIHS